ncbi:MAG: hypothetical protein ACMXYE_00220 [Candidatus Woesearchaeota archaeon]
MYNNDGWNQYKSKSTHSIKKFAQITKKGQAVTGASATNLIIAITVLIIIYILFLPPQERAALLGDQTTTVTTPSQPYGLDQSYRIPGGRETVFSEVPGSIDYSALNELRIPLNAFMLSTRTDAQTLEEFNPFYIKNGIGDRITKNLTFTIDNLQNVNNVMLSFTNRRHEGILTIRLNGHIIYEFNIESSQIEPIRIRKDLLQERNDLEFSVSGVGWQFWKTNEYSFENVKLIADVTDTTGQMSMNTFSITQEQGMNVDRARLKFNPECRTGEVGTLDIRINDRLVFSAIPDCGSLNFIDIPHNYILIGRNRIDFTTMRGSYLIDLITVEIDFLDNKIPVYYFDMDRKFFDLKIDPTVGARCGEIDGICPSGCSENNDYDCCMQQYTTPYWCVLPTANENDRCVGFVDETNAHRCPSGYIDRYGRIAKVSKNTCGDNHDGICPEGCSPELDKDCCFNQPGDQYWCEVLPTAGREFRCMNSVSIAQCDLCPTGYVGENSRPICQPGISGVEAEELKKEYQVLLEMRFTEDHSRKQADIYINGHLTRIDMTGITYQRDISHFVEPGSNSIEIVPFSVLNIRSLEVQVIQ